MKMKFIVLLALMGAASATPNYGSGGRFNAFRVFQTAVQPAASCNAMVEIPIESNGEGLVLATAINALPASSGALIKSLTVNPAGPLTCADINSTIPATLSYTFIDHDTDSCESTLTAVDNMAPIIACSSVAISLTTATTNVSMTTDILDCPVTDNCGSPIVTIDPATVSCADMPMPVTVTINAMDASGNTANQTVEVTLTDVTAPDGTCNAMVPVAFGATLTPEMLVTGLSDNCAATANLTATTTPALTNPPLGPITIADAGGAMTLAVDVAIMDTATPPNVLSCPGVNLLFTGGSVEVVPLLSNATAGQVVLAPAGSTLPDGEGTDGFVVTSLPATDNSGLVTLPSTSGIAIKNPEILAATGPENCLLVTVGVTSATGVGTITAGCLSAEPGITPDIDATLITKEHSLAITNTNAGEYVFAFDTSIINANILSSATVITAQMDSVIIATVSAVHVVDAVCAPVIP